MDVTALRKLTEYAYVIDCAKQGCDPKHEDDGRVVRGPYARPYHFDGKINGHATRLVRRVVPEWSEVTVDG